MFLDASPPWRGFFDENGGVKVTFSVFFSLLVNGLSMGMIYAMIAMGLILLIRAVGVLNFAQGDLLMVGAYIACVLFMDFQPPVLYCSSVVVNILRTSGSGVHVVDLLAPQKSIIPGGADYRDHGGHHWCFLKER